MARLLVLSFSTLSSDARVLRQVRELRARHDVTTAAFGRADIPGCTHVEVRRATSVIKKAIRGVQILMNIDESYLLDSDTLQQISRTVEISDFDLIVANDVDTLPLALRIARGRPVLLDAHEYSLDDDAVGLAGRLTLKRKKLICHKYLRDATRITTVSAPIAQLYGKKFDIPYPTVVPNASYFQNLNPSPVDFNQIQLIHHGIYTPNRGIEVLIDAVAKLGGRYVLNLMLVADTEAIAKLSSRARKLASKVVFHSPVPPSHIPSMINRFDVAVYALPPLTMNARMALPNKFFDNVQGRLCQVISPVGEMQRLLIEHELGRISRGVDAESIAETIHSLSTTDIETYKINSHRAARTLSWEAYSPLLHREVETALAEGRSNS